MSVQALVQTLQHRDRRTADHLNRVVGRVTALCDVYNALTSKRPYEVAWTPQEALIEIKAQAGRQFDPVLTQVFVGLLGDGHGLADWSLTA